MRPIRSIIAEWHIGLFLTLLILAGVVFEWYPIKTLEYRSYDFMAKLRLRPANAPLAIIAIDEKSISNIGRWPWPRSYMADMIDLLASSKAKIIGVNVLYTEPDKDSGLEEIRTLKKGIEEIKDFSKNLSVAAVHNALSEAELRLDNDAKLLASLESSKNVILPLFFTLGEQLGNPGGEFPDYLTNNSIKFPEGVAGFTSALTVTSPVPDFSNRAMALGHVNLTADEDGTIRKEPLIINYQGRGFPSFSLELVARYLNYNATEINISNDSIKIGKLDIPVDSSQKMFISYNGVPNTFPHYSFFEVLSGEVKPETFKDKIVLVGHTGVGIATFEVTPVQHTFPSVEIEANVIENILNQNHIIRPRWALYTELGVILFFGIYLSFIIPRMKAGLSAIISTVFLIIWNGFSIYMFVSNGYWVMSFAPSLMLGLGYTFIMSKRFLLTEQRKDLVEADSLEINKMLGLSFQGQGMLDLAFEKFRKIPLDDESIKDLLYNLALDFERKRMFNKAVAVYEHILTSGEYKDIKDKIQKLKNVGETMIFGGGLSKKGGSDTVIVEGAATTPTLGRYEVQKELGRGAMGTVFLGKDPKINRMVAIKTIRFDDVDQEQLPDIKARFFREAEAAGRLSHPNIVTIFDAGEDYDLAYVAMELLDGTDLAKFTLKENKLPLNEVLRIISAIADALDYAHDNGIVHRDIKPANIMLMKNNEVKVTDFGIARVVATSKTETGVILGTPSYMSPEQVVGKKVDGKSDLFSLGVVMFELLSLEKPFKGDSIATLMYSIANTAPISIKKLIPDIPDCVAYIVHKMMFKDIAKRYQRGKEIVRDINLCKKKAGLA